MIEGLRDKFGLLFNFRNGLIVSLVLVLFLVAGCQQAEPSFSPTECESYHGICARISADMPEGYVQYGGPGDYGCNPYDEDDVMRSPSKTLSSGSGLDDVSSEKISVPDDQSVPLTQADNGDHTNPAEPAYYPIYCYVPEGCVDGIDNNNDWLCDIAGCDATIVTQEGGWFCAGMISGRPCETASDCHYAQCVDAGPWTGDYCNYDDDCHCNERDVAPDGCYCRDYSEDCVHREEEVFEFGLDPDPACVVQEELEESSRFHECVPDGFCGDGEDGVSCQRDCSFCLAGDSDLNSLAFDYGLLPTGAVNWEGPGHMVNEFWEFNGDENNILEPGDSCIFVFSESQGDTVYEIFDYSNGWPFDTVTAHSCYDLNGVYEFLYNRFIGGDPENSYYYWAENLFKGDNTDGRSWHIVGKDYLDNDVCGFCGDGALGQNEVASGGNKDCDDPTLILEDGACNCQVDNVPICGNGVVEPEIGEQCDYGVNNLHPNDPGPEPPYDGTIEWCDTSCELHSAEGGSCGDGNVDIPYEECDPEHPEWQDGACDGNCEVWSCGAISGCNVEYGENCANCPEDCGINSGNYDGLCGDLGWFYSTYYKQGYTCEFGGNCMDFRTKSNGQGEPYWSIHHNIRYHTDRNTDIPVWDFPYGYSVYDGHEPYADENYFINQWNIHDGHNYFVQVHEGIVIDSYDLTDPDGGDDVPISSNRIGAFITWVYSDAYYVKDLSTSWDDDYYYINWNHCGINEFDPSSCTWSEWRYNNNPGSEARDIYLTRGWNVIMFGLINDGGPNRLRYVDDVENLLKNDPHILAMNSEGPEWPE
jgi:hypothetical protein